MFSDEFFANPHPIQARLRDETAVHRVVTPDGHVGWVVTRYAEARAALTDPRLTKGMNPNEPPISPPWRLVALRQRRHA